MAKQLFCILVAMLATACWTATPPPNVRTIVLKGDAYSRGFQHGQAFEWDIRSLYTRMLTNSLIPSLNEEQSHITSILGVYYEDRYLDGHFAYQMMLESAWNLWNEGFIPETYKKELQGLADGAHMPLDDVLVLNTFLDTMLAFRGVSLFIQELQKPRLLSLEVLGAITADGRDNDADGQTDEDGEGRLDDYRPSPYATLLEVPPEASFRLVFEDVFLGGLRCVDLENIDPIGEAVIERRCVHDDCVRPECADLPLLPRECLTWEPERARCVEPKVAFTCFDPNCVEIIDPECVDPRSIRVQIDETLYTSVDAPDVVAPRLLPLEEGEVYDPQGPGGDYPHARRCQGKLEVVVTPPAPLPPASVVTILLQAQDLSQIYVSPPKRARSMRDERIVLTTRGYAEATGTGATLTDVPNVGPAVDRAMPMPVSLALRGSATANGAPLAAQHFALLDGNILHEHTALFVQVPDEGEGLPHAYVGWTGLLWGFSGLNTAGMTYSVIHSDTLDNPLVGGVVKAIVDNLATILKTPDLSGLSDILGDVHLFARNLPLGFSGREILARATTVDQGLDILYHGGQTFGWNWMLADAEGGMIAVETDGSTDPRKIGKLRQQPSPVEEDGFAWFGPDREEAEALAPWGRPWGSVGPDDVRSSGHFVKNTDDAMPTFLATFTPKHQRFWSSYYYRAVRTWHRLGDEITARYGTFDVPTLIELLRTPDLVDRRDSMNAVIFEPARRVMHWAMGDVPATDQPFVELDLTKAVEDGVVP